MVPFFAPPGSTPERPAGSTSGVEDEDVTIVGFFVGIRMLTYGLNIRGKSPKKNGEIIMV